MAETGPVVSNTGPLIALSSIGKLDLLAMLYGSVLVPEGVFQEVTVDGRGRAGAAEVAAAAWISRVRLNRPPDALLLNEVGLGESEAITLAVQDGARLLLIDDRAARRIAEVSYGLRVKGAAGILVAAKHRGLIPAVRPLLEGMREGGYYLSDRLIAAACHYAREQ